ncbi:DUF6602 domain-containing protein [Clostridium thailandense]|uniref:DUF6602 domain-containing protein n=1 Tax=Clostridium thailandense TaxID=2794346 RepID=UPI003989CAA4
MININLELYHKSISDEFKICQNRVRDLIGSAHWGEEGRYKEVILTKVLRRYLPKHISVGTGFILKSEDDISKQIDIIVYDNRFPIIFSEGDFVILSPSNVLGIIEVKTKITLSNIEEIINKATLNGKMIGKNKFNGIFIYENNFDLRDETKKSREIVENALRKNSGYVNHISMGRNYFIKYWNIENPDVQNSKPCYSIYKIIDFSFPYFISNLIEMSYNNSLDCFNSNVKNIREYGKFLYTIQDGKESYRICNIECNTDAVS